jgi:hypothetical protein
MALVTDVSPESEDVRYLGHAEIQNASRLGCVGRGADLCCDLADVTVRSFPVATLHILTERTCIHLEVTPRAGKVIR